jgi:hypothetical protein
VRASRSLLVPAILGVGIAAAWLVVRFLGERPTDLDAVTSGFPPSSQTPPAPLAPPVLAERMKSRPETKDEGKEDDAGDDSGEAASAPAENLRDYWIRLSDENDGSPIADARVDVGPYDFELFQTVFLEWKGGPLVRTHSGSQSLAKMARATGRSGGDGCASFQVPRGRTPVAVVTAEGFLPVWFVASTKAFGGIPAHDDHASRERALEIGLVRTASFVVHVKRQGGDPVAGATIHLTFDGLQLRRPRSSFKAPFSQTAETEGTTDGSGRCAFDDLPADVGLSLRVFEPGSSQPIDDLQLFLEPAERREFDWIVDGRASLSGRVFGSESFPIAADVSLRPETRLTTMETATNGESEFSFEDVVAGEVSLHVEPKDGRYAPDDRILVLSPGEHRAGLVVELSAAAPLVVRAVDRKGDPVVNAQAQVWAFANRRKYVDSSRGEKESERAQIRFTSVPLGMVAVRVDPVGPDVIAGSEVFFNHDGEHECVVMLDPGGSLAGTIVDPLDGRARVAATVSIFRRRGAGRFDVQTSMQSMPEPGTFRFDNLAPGTYDLVATNHEGLVGVVAGVTLGAGEPKSGVVIEAARSATLQFIAPARRDPLPFGERYLIEVRRGEVRLGITGAPPNGRAHLNVPPGRLTVDLRAGNDLMATRDVDARVGVVTRVQF